MKELPPVARVIILGSAAAILLAALSGAGTRADPYAPNEWLFSHVFLAQKGIEDERLPFNRDPLGGRTFLATQHAFQEQTGLARLTLHANTVWHFWNGLPLQPAFLAGLSALTGQAPEQAARFPLAGLVVLVLTYASADLLLPSSSRFSHLAPFVVAMASTPFVLDMRTLMPPATLVIVALVLHFLLRRALAQDGRALACAVAPLALLPFWYYTMAYFVILLFVGFLVAAVLARVLRANERPVVPILVAVAVPVAMGGLLLLNGALKSQLQLATYTSAIPGFSAEQGVDYDAHLNRASWRSALLYTQLGLLFLPLGVVTLHTSGRLLARRRLDRAPAVFAQFALGGALFALLLHLLVGVSFLNRPALYLTPLAVLAALWSAKRARLGRACLAAALGVSVFATPFLVMTAAPNYSAGDGAAFEWAAEHVPGDARIYGSLEASSVMFRHYGYTQTVAFPPRNAILENFWYSTDTDAIVPYIASVQWFILRDDAKTLGFEEFGPLRQPISADAYDKFGRSPDLHRVFDNGEVEVYQVGIAPGRLLAGAPAAAPVS